MHAGLAAKVQVYYQENVKIVYLNAKKRSDLRLLQGVRRKREKERQLLNLKLRELLRILIKDFLATYIALTM